MLPLQATLFKSILSSSHANITLTQFILILLTSLLMGVLLAIVYKYKAQYTKEFVMTLTLLPTLIAIIIFLVNGNLGTSVAVAGAFSLIRFRSAAGSSKELLAVFLATAIGLATGMGYLLLAISFTVVLSALIFLLEQSKFVAPSGQRRYVILTVEKDFSYEHFFEQTLGLANKQVDLLSVQYKRKNENLVLEYAIEVDKGTSDKFIIDALLAAGPMEVVLHHQVPKMKRL